MKRSIPLVLSTLLTTSLILPLAIPPAPALATASAKQEPISLRLDGKPFPLKQQPMLVGGALYVPLREVLEACGVKVNWHPTLIEIIQGKRQGTFDPAHSNGDLGIRDSFKHDGRWMIHIRLLKYLVGADVSWDARTKTVNVSMASEPLFRAIEDHNAGLVQALLKKGLNPNAVRYNLNNFKEQTALHYAMTQENTDVVQALLAAGANSNIDPSPLYFAAKEGRTEIISMLLDSGVEPSHVDSNGALLSLIQNGYTESIQAFLFSAETRRDLDPTLLQKALNIAIDRGNFEAVRLLLQAGANPNGIKSIDEPYLLIAFPLIRATSSNDPRLVRLLLEQGADPNQVSTQGYTALHVAAEMGNQEILQQLISAKADLDLQTETGATAWMLAQARGNLSTAEFLRKAGAKTSPLSNDLGSLSPFHRMASQIIEDKKDMSPLMRATFLGETATVKKLLAEGHDPNVRDSTSAPLEKAASYGYVETVKALLNGRTKPHQTSKDLALHTAIVTHNLQVAELLLQSGADQNSLGQISPMYIAVERNYDDAITLLLKYGGTVQITDPSRTVSPVLTVASRQGNAAALQALLNADVDYHADRSDMDFILTALYPAIDMGNYDCISLLLAMKPDQRVLMHALLHAVTVANKKAIQMLLDEGLDPTSNLVGISALEIAEQDQNHEIIDLLQSTTP